MWYILSLFIIVLSLTTGILETTLVVAYKMIPACTRSEDILGASCPGIYNNYPTTHHKGFARLF